MLNENEFVAVWVRKTTKERLRQKKVHPKQPFYEVVDGLLDNKTCDDDYK
jgi:hypothetical protein